MVGLVSLIVRLSLSITLPHDDCSEKATMKSSVYYRSCRQANEGCIASLSSSWPKQMESNRGTGYPKRRSEVLLSSVWTLLASRHTPRHYPGRTVTKPYMAALYGVDGLKKRS
jgi:hypothetical protein